MRTNIVLDDDLIKEAFAYSKVKTKKALIHLALKEFIDLHRRKDLREIRGKVKFQKDYNYKELRKGRF